MEFCPRCQQLKPFYVIQDSNRMVKMCRDCNLMMGSIEVPEINILINELNFYKEKFYKSEIESCQKNTE
jgi:hypothetical protein